MATKVGEAYYELTAKNRKLKAKLRESDQATASWTKKMSGMVGKLGKMAFAGAVAGVAAVTAVMVKATQAAAAEEIQTEQLAHQLGRLGLDSETAMRQVDKLAASQQAYTRFGDTDTRRMLAQLIMLTDDYEGSMRNVSLAQDMAESGMFDARSAGRMLGMAMQGNIEILGRYIPELKTSNNEALKTMTTSQKAAFAIDLLNKKFGGLARQMGETTAGAWAKMKNAASDAMEAMGAGVLDATEAGLLDITETIQDMEPTLRKVGETAAVFVDNLSRAAKWWVELLTDADEMAEKRRRQVNVLVRDTADLTEKIRDLVEQQVMSAEAGEAMLDAWEAPLEALKRGEITFSDALDKIVDLEVNFEKRRAKIEDDFRMRRELKRDKEIADERKRRKEAVESINKELGDARLKRMGLEDVAEANAIERRYKKLLEKVSEFEDLRKFVREQIDEEIEEAGIKRAEEAAKKIAKVEEKALKESAERRKQRLEEAKEMIEERLKSEQSVLDLMMRAEQTFLRATGQGRELELIEFERRYEEMFKLAAGNEKALSLLRKAYNAEWAKMMDDEIREIAESSKLVAEAFRPELVGARELARRAMVARPEPKAELLVKAEPSDEDKKHTQQFKEMIELQRQQVDNTRQNIAVFGP